MRHGALTLFLLLAALASRAAPFETTYEPMPGVDTVIAGTTIFTGDGRLIENGYVVVRDGRIASVGEGVPDAPDVAVFDGAGMFLTPGIIDVHSHLGVYPVPSYSPHSDGNEATQPNTAEVWAEHSVWPQDPMFPLALAGGVTTMQILPGSANLFGGRSVTLKNVSSRTVQGMKFPGAPYGLKMACGENPQRVYGSRGQSPATRMGNVAGYRAAWIDAVEYREKWEDYERDLAEYDPEDEDVSEPEPPKRNLQLETMMDVLNGEVLIHNHCYRADEMAVMLDVAREFGYSITAFHHAVESYKIADLLADAGVCSAMWADWGRFKLESFDAIEENVALVDAAGACAIVHSDSRFDIQRLNQEAAKALAAGRRLGLEISEAEAMRWITLNAAEALGIGDETGSIEAGKMADLVLWDGNPFSVYARPARVYIDGAVVYDRFEGIAPVTDYELGQREEVQ